ncbi:hypothetical protein CGRA01v4_04371 [Colletotrichum graminicola]|nr:hypothetical protein CGRA01v4_04371 [Colletotrichum graminicola]
MGKTVHLTNCPSLSGSELANSNQKAFRALMEHIGQSDKDQQTILMVQVGGQSGLGKDFQDSSTAVNAAIGANVSQAFVDYLKQAGYLMTHNKGYSHELEHTADRTLATVVKDVYPLVTFTTVPLGDTKGMHRVKASQPLLGLVHPQDRNNIQQLWSAFGSYWGVFDFTTEMLSTGSFHGGACGLVIHQAEGKLLALAYGFLVKARSILSNATFTRVLSFHMLEPNQDCGYDTVRCLNTDEASGGRVAQMPPSEPMITEVRFCSFDHQGLKGLRTHEPSWALWHRTGCTNCWITWVLRRRVRRGNRWYKCAKFGNGNCMYDNGLTVNSNQDDKAR